jgi:hypothetical protein
MLKDYPIKAWFYDIKNKQVSLGKYPPISDNPMMNESRRPQDYDRKLREALKMVILSGDNTFKVFFVMTVRIKNSMINNMFSPEI